MDAKTRAKSAGDAQGRRRQTAYEMEAGQRKRLLRVAQEHAAMKALLERLTAPNTHSKKGQMDFLNACKEARALLTRIGA